MTALQRQAVLWHISHLHGLQTSAAVERYLRIPKGAGNAVTEATTVQFSWNVWLLLL